MNAISLYKKLPHETQIQIQDVLSDDGLELTDVDTSFLFEEIEWSIKKMRMNLADGGTVEQEKYWAKTIKQCQKLLKQLGK